MLLFFSEKNCNFVENYDLWYYISLEQATLFGLQNNFLRLQTRQY